MNRLDKNKPELPDESDTPKEQAVEEVQNTRNKDDTTLQEIDELITVVLPIINNN